MNNFFELFVASVDSYQTKRRKLLNHWLSRLPEWPQPPTLNFNIICCSHLYPPGREEEGGRVRQMNPLIGQSLNFFD